jgi:hypothetical protein
MNWITTLCESSGCVQVASTPTSVLVRSTEHPENILNLATDEFRAFRDAVKDGHFDEV